MTYSDYLRFIADGLPSGDTEARTKLYEIADWIDRLGLEFERAK